MTFKSLKKEPIISSTNKPSLRIKYALIWYKRSDKDRHCKALWTTAATVPSTLVNYGFDTKISPNLKTKELHPCLVWPAEWEVMREWWEAQRHFAAWLILQGNQWKAAQSAIFQITSQKAFQEKCGSEWFCTGATNIVQKFSHSIAYSNFLTNLLLQLSSPGSLLQKKPPFAFLVLNSLRTLCIQEGKKQDLDCARARSFTSFKIANQ